MEAFFLIYISPERTALRRQRTPRMKSWRQVVHSLSLSGIIREVEEAGQVYAWRVSLKIQA